MLNKLQQIRMEVAGSATVLACRCKELIGLIEPEQAKLIAKLIMTLNEFSETMIGKFLNEVKEMKN